VNHNLQAIMSVLVAAGREPVSPELVLVDPELRRRLLAEAMAEIEMGTVAPAPPGGLTRPAEPADASPRHRPRKRRERAADLALGAVCGAAVALALMFVVTGRPFAPRSAAVTNPVTSPVVRTVTIHAGPVANPAHKATFTPPVQTTQTLPALRAPGPEVSSTVARQRSNYGRTSGSGQRSRTASRPAAPKTEKVLYRQFAWAQTQGVTSYVVALYRGPVRVFQAVTHEPSIEIPVDAKDSKSSKGVLPGTYRWYVWPLRGRLRDRVAVVDSKVVLTAN
jgi:hypothetical protein